MKVLKKIFNKQVFPKWFSVLVIAEVFVVVAYYLIFPSRGYFHADCTDTLMWAVASYESGTLFNPDFTYACILPFGGQLLMQPFIGIFGVSMTTHIIGMFLFMILFSLFFILLLREMKWNYKWIAAAYTMLMLTVSSSDKIREIFWGHVIYYSLGILFVFIGMFMIFRTYNMYEQEKTENKKMKLIILLSVLLLWCTLCGMNQVVSITIFSLPVAAAVFADRFFDFDGKVLSKKTGFCAVTLALVLVGTVVGYGITAILSKGIYASYEDAYSLFSSPDDWLNNLLKFPVHWFSLLGVTVVGGEHLMSVEGVIALLRVIGAILLTVLPVIGTCMYSKSEDRYGKMMLIVHWGVTLLVMMGYVCGRLSAANWRLCPIVCTAVISSLITCKWIAADKRTSRLAVLLMVPQFMACAFTEKDIISMPSDYGKDGDLYTISEFLEENDLHYGYSTFWTANCITVISNDSVKTRCININDEGVIINPYQSNKKWYEDVPGADKYFVLLNGSEYNDLTEKNADFINSCDYTLEFRGYEVLVYNHNIF